MTDRLLFAVAVAVGLFFRLFDLGGQGAWNDEMASYYYAKFPFEALLRETHPPLFYLTLSPFVAAFGKNLLALRLVVTVLGLGLIAGIGLLARQVLDDRRSLILVSMLLLGHLDIIHGRMLRHYGLFLELSVFYLLAVQALKPRSVLLVGLAVSFLHPLGFLLPLSLFLLNLWETKRADSKSMTFGIPVIAIGLYYAAKVTLVARDFRPVPTPVKVFSIWEDVLRSFAGEFYPKINFFPVSAGVVWAVALVVIGSVGLGIAWGIRSKKLDPQLKVFFVLVVVTFVVSGLVSATFFNLNVGRYYLFLLAPWLLAVVSLFGAARGGFVVTIVLQLALLLVLNPLQRYPQEEDALAHYRVLAQAHPGLELVLCGTEYQFAYLLDRPKENCVEKFRVLRGRKKSFGFVDLSGQGQVLFAEARGTYTLIDVQVTGGAISGLALYQGPP